MVFRKKKENRDGLCLLSCTGPPSTLALFIQSPLNRLDDGAKSPAKTLGTTLK